MSSKLIIVIFHMNDILISEISFFLNSDTRYSLKPLYLDYN